MAYHSSTAVKRRWRLNSVAEESSTVGASQLLLVTALFAQTTDLSKGLNLFIAGRYDEAARVLDRALEQKQSAYAGGQALYVLATIRAAQRDKTQAAKTLERLVSEYADSPWVLHAYDRLAEQAVTDAAWDRATDLTCRFLDLYLAGPFATIDDRVCRRAFDRLSACEQKAAPARPLPAIHAGLKARYPRTSAAGRVVAFFAAVDPNVPDANLIKNGGFELDAREIASPIGWSYVGTEPNLQDDFDGTLRAGGPTSAIVMARSGRFCAGKFTNWYKHLGWLYQRVPVLSGRRYDVSAYGMTPVSKDNPGCLRLGVDPTGGTNPQANTVRWTRPVSAIDEYRNLAFDGTDAVAASGPYLTVFLEVRQETVADPNAMLFDDVTVRQVK